MNYTASIADFFQSPKWLSNLFLGGVCILIPILGPMVVLGWLVSGFWSRVEEDFATFRPSNSHNSTNTWSAAFGRFW